MKEQTDNKVPLVKMSQDDPLYPLLGGQQQQQPRGVQHDQGEGYQQPITFRRVSQSGQVEIKIEYLITTTLYLTELDIVLP